MNNDLNLGQLKPFSSPYSHNPHNSRRLAGVQEERAVGAQLQLTT
jgi:hypothetical protein